MENLALPTVILLLALLPGILFLNGYLNGKFPKRIFESSPVSELAHYFIFAIPIDAVGLALLKRGSHPLFFAALVRIFTGQYSEASVSDIVIAVMDSWRTTLLRYFLLLAAASILARTLRRIVWTLRLDVVLPSIRMKHDWYYILQGRLPGLPRRLLPYADILVEHPDGSLLYRGLIVGIEIAKDGEIKQLILNDAQRGKGRGEEFQWKDVPGDQFILQGRSVHSINMRYFYVEPPKRRWARFKWSVKAYVWSFLFEEP
jgi:hypothetical protein